MGRSRYTITEPDRPHFMTCTVLEWLPVFTCPETVQILLDCWRYQKEHEGLRLYGYVILENHLHFIAQANNLNQCVHSFKSYTARQYQFWQEGVHPELVFSEAMMREKLDYIHGNPVKRGYVSLVEHWRYSSAAN